MLRYAIIAGILAMLLIATFPGKTRSEELPFPDLFVMYGCAQEQTSLNLAHIWVKKGKYWFNEAASDYVLNGECFILGDPGFPAYIDRVVRKVDKKFEGDDAYVVEGHFFGDPPEKTFFFMYHGELPAKARRSAI